MHRLPHAALFLLNIYIITIYWWLRALYIEPLLRVPCGQIQFGTINVAFQHNLRSAHPALARVSFSYIQTRIHIALHRTQAAAASLPISFLSGSFCLANTQLSRTPNALAKTKCIFPDTLTHHTHKYCVTNCERCEALCRHPPPTPTPTPSRHILDFQPNSLYTFRILLFSIYSFVFKLYMYIKRYILFVYGWCWGTCLATYKYNKKETSPRPGFRVAALSFISFYAPRTIFLSEWSTCLTTQTILWRCSDAQITAIAFLNSF